MKNNIAKSKPLKLALFALALTPNVSFANCGDLPKHPSFLAEEYILHSDLQKTSAILDEFLIDVDTYQTCIEEEFATLKLVDIDSPDQQRASQLSEMADLLYESQTLAIDRHNEMLSRVEIKPLIVDSQPKTSFMVSDKDAE